MKHLGHQTQRAKIRIWGVIKTVFIYALVTIIICIQVYRFGEAFRHWWKTKEFRQTYIQEIERLEKQNESMKAELNSLKNSNLIKERLAREMGYVKQGEIVYRIKD